MTSVAVIIPFRDRGRDPLRAKNLTRILEHWSGFAPVTVATDGGTGDQQFNRSRAYNQAIGTSTADVFVLTEADMLIDDQRIVDAITAATEQPGLVVPFTERHEHDAFTSELIRDHRIDFRTARANIIKTKPRRTGAINVISRHTYQLVGRYDETFTGSWWDDRSMHHAFDICAAPTRWINGPAHHLWHLPGYQGPHLTAADRRATAGNKQRFRLYQSAKTPEQIRTLTCTQGESPQDTTGDASQGIGGCVCPQEVRGSG